LQLEGKFAIVTGGGKGIGAGIARGLAGEGCSVAVAGRAAGPLESIASEIKAGGRDAFAATCDVSKPADVESLFRKVEQRWGQLDILVNNAGQSHSELLVKLSLETWQRMLDINMTGTFLCSQAALKLMLPRKSGRIVNIASTASQIGYRYAGAYAAAKHGVLGLTRSMALETATSSITVNAICPGWVESEMFQSALETISSKTKMTEEQARAILAKDSPQNRIMQPDEIASAVLWLCSDGARGVTGQAIGISGGQVMH
jgi:NAD(P)-dependent dehydrogenase (short-subunit alcohol dehydrogenase family)